MDNHPVPQNISSYEFRLVGDMTLKQFLQLAGGIVVGVLIFRLQLIPIIKYPLVFISITTGALMAFIPINNRPFTTWLVAFFKAIYSPTEYVWISDEIVASLAPPPPITPTATAAPPSPPTPQPVTTVPAPIPAAIKIEPQMSTAKTLPPSTTPNSAISSIVPTPAPNSTVPPIIPTSAPSSAPIPTSPARAQPVFTSPVKNSTSTPTISTSFSSAGTPHAEASPQTVLATPTTPTSPILTSSGVSAVVANTPPLPKPVNIPSAPSATVTTQLPNPASPNILTGMVVDAASQPLAQTTVEIIDTKTGIPARALRTNRLGQFQIAIPLPAGTYNVIAEKEGLTFDPVSIQAKGSIISPVIIHGKT